MAHVQCLMIDDEKMLADSTVEYCNLFGVSAAAVYDAQACRAYLTENTVDLLLLDINLGGESGLALCKSLRETTDAPILFISARSADEDKIAALTLGGDDYIEKPYSLPVLLAKIKAVLKRMKTADVDVWSDGRLKVDFPAKTVSVSGKAVRLTAMEFKLLRVLIENAGRVVEKAALFDLVWGDRFTGDGTLNVHIRRLREAIEPDPNAPVYIVTVWGDGYRFEGKTL